MSSVRRAKNRKQQLREPSDRISSLPLTVLQQILECLPLQQAARTSILSKHWRNKWASTSQLILDESFVKSICEKRSEPSAILLTYNKAINDILLSHVGPIGKFRARCELIDLSLEETRAIKVLSLYIYGQKLQKSRNMADFFSCLANVEKLSLFEAYYLNDFTSPKRFPKSLTRLQVLQLMQIPLNCKSSISLALCLLLSSPNLKQLHIEAMKREVESDDQLNQFDNPCIFRCLKTVHLVGITGLSNELKLIKFLLACSPVLDEMTIELGTEMGVAEKQANFFKELNQYRRASPNAEMIIKT